MEYLDLSVNHLRKIPEILSQYTEIVSLNLSFNKIDSLPAHIFSRMWRMKTLDLSNNLIKRLSDIEAGSLFAGNTKLQTLNLSKNALTDLGDGYDQILYSDSLLFLDVSDCSILHVQGAIVLQGLRKLTHLNLSKNSITRIDGLTSDSLIFLDVSGCKIQFFRSDSFERLTRLKVLHGFGNRHLSDQYWKPSSKSISYIDVSYCSIDSNYASDLAQSETVILKGNLLREIPAKAFQNNSKLEFLDLSENKITYIDEFAFYGIESLRYLDLSGNLITNLDENTFIFTSTLINLNLSHNSFQTIKTLKIPTLQNLDISNCRINGIDSKTLVHLSALRALNISYNSLQTLPENWTSYSLQELDVSFCRITMINELNFHSLTSLKQLDLSGNRLVQVKNNTFSKNKLIRISLTNNPWRCDCTDENFHTFWKYLTIDSKVEKVNSLLCLFPDNVTGKSWDIACYREWTTTPKSKDIIVLIIIVLVLLISGIVACVVAVKEKHRINESERSTNGSPELQNIIHAETITAHNENTIRESIRKFTQLPSYDEALLLPKRQLISSNDTESNISHSNDHLEKSKKRQSATQTDESITALLEEIAAEEQNIYSNIRRRSIQEMEYINIKPLTLQCTEL